MKTFLQVLLVAACFVACTRSFPRSSPSIPNPFEEEDNDDPYFFTPQFQFPMLFERIIQNLRRTFSGDITSLFHETNIPIPEGANTTSTTKIIDGHVVTLNETTYSRGNENGDISFRIRIIDVKPLNETEVIGGGSTEQPSEPDPGSRETVEEFNNEIPKNTETLTA
ncbi:PREDICTED: icarapin-like [Trachymyrmex cornetzi]|uniref:icarapin-like n=1 Tax=Trachymyrmex cornetzi TaxID=471704 RepID=UPI00084EE6E2|nr:PREDICTED: icarapin-like [Trachymyrmex cornetzi]